MPALTANRVAAIVGALTGLAAFVAGVAQVLPGAWPNYALAASGLLVKLATVLKFLDGAQNFDALQLAGVPKGARVVNAPGEEPGDPDALPHLAATDPAVVPPDEGDPRTPDPAVPPALADR